MPTNNHHNSALKLNNLQGTSLFYKTKRNMNFEFSIYYHPYIDELIEKLNKDGLIYSLDPEYLKLLTNDLNELYTPGSWTKPFPFEEIDVSDDGPYSIYNWELFFHAPLSVACHLSKNKKFEEARNLCHFIFYPITEN